MQQIQIKIVCTLSPGLHERRRLRDFAPPLEAGICVDQLSILIVEDEGLIALGLAMAAEDAGAVVIGPVATVADALALLDIGGIGAAVVDVDLLDRDIMPVAIRLIEAGLPFIVHSAAGLPRELATTFPDATLVMKPARADYVVECLLAKMR